MLYSLIGLVIGIVVGIFLPFEIAPEYSRYTAIIILVILDSLIGAIRAQIKGEFNTLDFVTGFLFYGVIALFFIYLGNKLNIDLYLAVIIVFVFRILSNIGIIRHFYFRRFFKDDKEKTEIRSDHR